MNAIVIFTIADDATKKYLNIFFPENLWNNWKYKIFEFKNNEDNIESRFVFINDAKNEESFSSSEEKIIRNALNSSDSLYVVFHKKRKLNKILDNCRSVIDHHNTDGWSYQYLLNISDSKDDYLKCSNIIKEFLKKFPDPILEAHIALLKRATIVSKMYEDRKSNEEITSYIKSIKTDARIEDQLYHSNIKQALEIFENNLDENNISAKLNALRTTLFPEKEEVNNKP